MLTDLYAQRYVSVLVCGVKNKTKQKKTTVLHWFTLQLTADIGIIVVR